MYTDENPFADATVVNRNTRSVVIKMIVYRYVRARVYERKRGTPKIRLGVCVVVAILVQISRLCEIKTKILEVSFRTESLNQISRFAIFFIIHI